MVNSPMSSLGMNDRPTMAFSGNVVANATTAIAMIAPGCSRAHLTEAVYPESSFRKNQLSFVLLSFTASDALRNRELSIGVSVKLTTMDTRIEKVIVQPNG